MIDEGEMDWKYICLAVNDPLAQDINDLQTLEKYMPGRVKELTQWFKTYKIPDGKPETKFAFNDVPLNETESIEVLKELHLEYKDLINAQQSGLLSPPKKK